MCVLLMNHIIAFIRTTAVPSIYKVECKHTEKASSDKIHYAAPQLTSSAQCWLHMGCNIEPSYKIPSPVDWRWKYSKGNESEHMMLIQMNTYYLHLQRILLPMQMCEERSIMSSVLQLLCIAIQGNIFGQFIHMQSLFRAQSNINEGTFFLQEQ